MSPAQPAYEVQFTDVALKNLRRYPKQDQRRILERIEELAADPHSMRNVKRLVEHDIDILPRSRAYRR